MRGPVVGCLTALLLLGACAGQPEDGSDADGDAGGEEATTAEPAEEAFDEEACEALATLAGDPDSDRAAFQAFVNRVDAAALLHERYPEEGFGPYEEALARMERTLDEYGADPNPDSGSVTDDVEEDLRPEFHAALGQAGVDYAQALRTPPASTEFVAEAAAACDVDDFGSTLPLGAYPGPDAEMLDAAHLDDHDPVDEVLGWAAPARAGDCGTRPDAELHSLLFTVRVDTIEGACRWSRDGGVGSLGAAVGRVDDEVLEALDAGGEPHVTEDGDELAAWLSPDGRGVFFVRSRDFPGGVDAVLELLDE